MRRFHHSTRWPLAVSAAALLSACGGGGGSGLNSIPTPVPSPTPAPTQTPTPASAPIAPPIPAGPIGLTSAGVFATEVAGSVITADPKTGVPVAPGVLSGGADLVAISYDPADQRYTVTIPTFEPGQLIHPSGNGSFQSGATVWQSLYSTFNEVTKNGSSELQNVHVTLDWPASSPYSYTNFGSWDSSTDVEPGRATVRYGVFTYGVPTPAGAVPVTGSASFEGQIRGVSQNTAFQNVYGSVSMNFDFAAGLLNGVLRPTYSDGWDDWAFAPAAFRETVYASGGTSFSGKFDTAVASADARFAGQFTGPGASELMANFQGTFLLPEFQRSLTISGVWIAAKK